MSVTSNPFLDVLALSLVVSSKLGGYRTENNPSNISSEQAMLELAKLQTVDISLSAHDTTLLFNIYQYFQYLATVKLLDTSPSPMWQQISQCYESGVAFEQDYSSIAKLPALYESTPLARKAQVIEKAAVIANEWQPLDYINNRLAFVYSSVKAKKFKGYNILAAIDRTIISWFSPVDIAPGLIQVTGQVKSVTESIDSTRSVFRLQHVKIKSPHFSFKFNKFNSNSSSSNFNNTVESDSDSDLPWD